MYESDADLTKLMKYLYKNMDLILEHQYLHKRVTKTLEFPDQSKEEYIESWGSSHSRELAYGDDTETIRIAYYFGLNKKMVLNLIEDMDDEMIQIVDEVYS